jgi:hypothetical protein
MCANVCCLYGSLYFMGENAFVLCVPKPVHASEPVRLGCCPCEPRVLLLSPLPYMRVCVCVQKSYACELPRDTIEIFDEIGKVCRSAHSVFRWSLLF